MVVFRTAWTFQSAWRWARPCRSRCSSSPRSSSSPGLLDANVMRTYACVFRMWGKPLSLDFHPFESATLLMTVLLASFVIQTVFVCLALLSCSCDALQGKSQWMMGALLIGCYGVVAAGPQHDPSGRREACLCRFRFACFESRELN